MKKIVLLLILFFACQWAFADPIDTTFNKENFVKLVNKTNELTSDKNTILIVAGVVSLIISALSFFGGKELFKSAITEMLANKIKVKAEHLEEMLKEQTKEFDAKTNRKIIIISSHSEPTIATIRGLLTNGGFKNPNLEFKGINDAINLADKSLVLFNDNREDSTLTTTQIETFINTYKVQLKTYFYFGVERNMPLDEWRTRHGITISSSNLPDRLATGILTFLKTSSIS
jgi:hypothetical protein